mgnify:CR=1 FL=1
MPDEKPPNRAAWWAAGAAAVVLLIAGIALANSSGPPDDEAASDEPSATATADPAPEGTTEPEATPAPDPEPQGPDAGELEDFIDDYLSTAEGDSQDGFDLLTPEAQAASGGFEQYDAFWSNVDDVNVEQSQGDQASGTVTFTFSYTMDGQDQTQGQTAQVVETDDGLRIASLS